MTDPYLSEPSKKIFDDDDDEDEDDKKVKLKKRWILVKKYILRG